jgi:CO/xanthine dehydrogenase Mo-binding subunit
LKSWDANEPPPGHQHDWYFGPASIPSHAANQNRACDLPAIEKPRYCAGLQTGNKNLNISYAELLARNGLPSLVADADYDPVEEAKGPKAVFSFSEVFAEVRVDPELGLVRLNRYVGAYDAGRIINPKTARSQAMVASSGA